MSQGHKKKHNPGHKRKNAKMQYNAARRWVANKLKRMSRHMKNHPNDKQTEGAIFRA